MPDPISLSIALAAAIVGGVVRGYSGFAGALIMLPVLTILFGPVTGIVTVLLVDMAGICLLMPEALRRGSMRISLPLILGSLVAIPFGSYLLLIADPEIMKKVIIYAVIGAATAMLFGWRYVRPLGPLALAGVGLISGGFLSAAYVGAIVALVLYAGPDNAKASRANAILWSFFSGWVLVAILIFSGVVTETELWRVFILSPFYFGAIYAGSRLVRGIDEILFRRTVLGILIIGSVVGVVFF
ncbi:MAG: hypothetical protein CMM55_03545 [Rhodospirillaceae bacterium]|jgi:uncharacterized membrane protein YfcA|nr:hypothetical protein [Rhodospirillaceae bacterium]|tara:strand:+ start:155 stop:880 length:726 start_codon:yes stop_codon:yes gene_type:complete